MADRSLNPGLQRVPLQESKTYNNNANQLPSRLNTFNTHVVLGNKPDQSYNMARSVNTLVKPSMTVPQLDKNNTRPRIALQQKPFNGSNTQPLKTSYSTRVPSNSILKDRPVSGFASTVPNYTRSEVPISQKHDQAQHLPQPQDTEPHPQHCHKTREKAVYGTPAWNLQMANVLPRCRFYFDSVDPSMTKKITEVVRRHKGSTTSFFSNEVTHIITTRPTPENNALERAKNQDESNQDSRKGSTKLPGLPVPNAEASILVKALSLGIKIWTLESTLKLLAPLAPELFKQTDNRKLKDMLQYEKVHGVATVNIDSSTKPDFYAFEGKYVLVDDTTGHYRTIMAYDFTATPSSTGKHPWPKLYIQDSDRSPFCYIEPVAKVPAGDMGVHNGTREDVKANRETNAAQDIQPLGDLKISPSAMVSGIVNSITSNIISTTTSAAIKPAAINPQQDRRVEQLEKRALNATKAEIGLAHAPKKSESIPPPLVQKDSKNPAQEAGIQATEPDNTTNVGRTPVIQPPDQPNNQTPGSITPTNNENTIAQGRGAARSETKFVQPTQPPAETANSYAVSHKEPKDYRKQRYCENCRGFFENFEKHIESPAHRKYAHDASKFAQLDILLAQLQRKPRISSTLSVTSSASPVPPEPETNDDISTAATCNAADIIASDSIIKNNGLKANDDTFQQQGSLESADAPLVQSDKDLIDCKDNQIQEIQDDGKQLQKSHVSTNMERDYQDEEDEGIVEDMDDENAHSDIDDQEALAVGSNGSTADVDAIAEELSSELSQLGLSGRGIDRFNDQPNNIDPENPFVVHEEKATVMVECHKKLQGENKAMESSSLQKVLRREFRLPDPDRSGPTDSNLTSQLETDITQPDDRFLDRSASTMASVDDGLSTPIRLCFDTSSMAVSPSAPRTIGVSRGLFSPDGMLESDREGSDDAVALVKSPSAGRGMFARNQGITLKNGLLRHSGSDFLSYSPTKDITSGLYKGALKRKLENVLAEERAVHQGQSRLGVNSPGTPMPSGTFASQLSLSNVEGGSQQNLQSYHSSQALPRLESWVNQSHIIPTSQGSSPLSPLVHNEPLELLFQSTKTLTDTTVKPHEAVVHRSQQQQAQLASGYFHPSLSSELESQSPKLVRLESRTPQQATKPQQSGLGFYSRQQLHPVGTPIVPFQTSNVKETPTAKAPTTSPGPMFSGQRTPERHISQSSPIAYSSPGGSQSPVDAVNFMDHSSYGFSSPIRSPSRRAQRTYFPVMTHAEQEEERVYQYYNGNQLPVPAGQKKMRSSSSLTEAYEEYGEGAMVFIE
ncbi:hypothetical protein FBU30_005389 [Linnemannia zychae]|nr:hypothetical protein FBU30_005389 [Linnemannia zychae]